MHGNGRRVGLKDEQGRQTANAWGLSPVVAAFQEISQFDDRDLQHFVRQAEDGRGVKTDT